MFLVLDHRQKSTEHGAAIADEPHIYGMPQTDAGRIAIDLDRLCLSRLRQKLHVREATSGNNECVALFECILRRRCAQETYAARGVRVAIRNHRLA